MKAILAIFGLVFVSLSVTVASAAPSTVDCLGYTGEDVALVKAGRATGTLPFGNILRIEKAKVQGKDRLTLFTTKDSYIARYVLLGSFQMAPRGFTFKGTETASYDDAEIALNERTLTIQIGGMKSTRTADSLGDSQNGKDCRQGMFPESLYF